MQYAIGVLIPSAEINFFGSVVHGIEQMTNMHGYNVLIYQTNESKDNYVKGMETIDQQTVLMGKESFKLLLNVISNGNRDVHPQKIILDPVPVFRQSSLRYNINIH